MSKRRQKLTRQKLTYLRKGKRDNSRAKRIEPAPKAVMGKVLDFGKHKGKTISAIAEEDPGYIKWMAREGLLSKVVGVKSIN